MHANDRAGTGTLTRWRIFPLATVFFLMALAGCGGDGGEMITDRVHDLVALMDRAEFRSEKAYTLQYAVSLTEDENRDGLAFFRASPETPVTFRNLFTRGEAVLHFGCGRAYMEGEGNPAPVLFRIEARNDEGRDDDAGTAGEAPMETLFEARFAPADFPGPEGCTFFLRPLPGAGALS